jgi:DNA topoisomerase-1
MADAEYVSKKLSISAPPLAGGIIPEYKKAFEKCIFAGWQIVANKNKDDDLFDYVGLLSEREVELNKLVSTYSIKKLKSHLTEAKLVQSLEKAGIGRPSTFSSLVDKIQSRKYVKKQDVKGRSVKCPIVTLENNTVSCSHVVKSFGDEKGKLVIQKLGTEVMEFLIENFDEVFRYSFTKEMEQKLDKIAQGELSQAALCSECHEIIKRVIAEKGLQKSQNLKLDATHTYIVGKYGPCIMQKKDGKTSFLKLKEGVTREMLIDKKLSITEVTVPKVGGGEVICTHEGHPILLKQGRFGPFLRWKDKNYKWKGILPDVPSADEAIRMLVQDVKLTEDVWLKHNEHGYYVMKRNAGAKPSFASVPSAVDCLKIRDVKAWLENSCKF